jgi:diguanylate cyclase (GGDEF)-like protein/PAS domain S-box-containing protein
MRTVLMKKRVAADVFAASSPPAERCEVRAADAAAADSEGWRHEIMEYAEDAIFVTTPAGAYLYANPAALRMTGYTLEELRALDISQLLDASDLPRLDEHLEATRRGERRLLDWHLRRKDRTVFIAELSTLQLPDGRFLAIGRDVSQRKQTEQNLKLAAKVFEEAMEGIIITDASAAMVNVNRAFTELTGYSREELIGRNPRLLHSGHQEASFYRDMWHTLLDSGRWQGEIWNRRKDGELLVMDVTIGAAASDVDGGRHYIGFFSDVTERRRQQERTEGLAYYDALTGLPNRVLFSDRVQQALLAVQRQGGTIALCSLDLNDFKPINDNLGHMAGDEMLSITAHRLQACVRAHDTVARLGGDEFALLLGGLRSLDEIDAVINRVLSAVAQPRVLRNGRSAAVTASIGVALYPDAGGDFDTLLRHADEAMYFAKRTRSGSRVWRPAGSL